MKNHSALVRGPSDCTPRGGGSCMLGAASRVRRRHAELMFAKRLNEQINFYANYEKLRVRLELAELGD
jgi:hypothetical protein